jgi:MFS transporter, PPP family, 3-phenylpropionic acid transporter
MDSPDGGGRGPAARYPLFLLVNASIYIAFSFLNPFLGAYYARAGLDTVQIGLLSTVGTILSICVVPLWGLFSDRSGRRKTVFLTAVLGTAGAVLLYLAGTGFPVFLLASVATVCFSSPLIPLSDAILIEHARRTHLRFSTIRLGGTIGYSVSVLAAGFYLRQHPSAIFPLASLGFLGVFLIAGFLPSERPTLQNENPAGPTGVPVPVESADDRVGLRLVIAFAFVAQLGLSVYGSFFGVYLSRLGYGNQIIGIASTISALSEIPALLLLDRLLRRFGALRILAFSGFMVALRLVVLTGEGLPFVVVAQLLQSVTYMTLYYSAAMYMGAHAPKARKSFGQSRLAMTSGVASITGSLVGGTVIRAIGIRGGYLATAATVAALSVGMALVLRRARRSRTALLES